MVCRARPKTPVLEISMRKFEGIVPMALALLVAACAPFPPGTSFRDCPECPEMVVVPAGSFMMGASASEAAGMTGGVRHHGKWALERPRHSVTIDRPFALGTYKVTREDYAAFVRETGYGDIEAC